MNFEEQYMPAICAKWLKRAADINLPKKGKKRDMDLGAYLEGVLTAAVAAGLIPVERHSQLWLLFAVGRAEDFVIEQALRHKAAQLIGAAPADRGFPAPPS